MDIISYWSRKWFNHDWPNIETSRSGLKDWNRISSKYKAAKKGDVIWTFTIIHADSLENGQKVSVSDHRLIGRLVILENVGTEPTIWTPDGKTRVYNKVKLDRERSVYFKRHPAPSFDETVRHIFPDSSKKLTDYFQGHSADRIVPSEVAKNALERFSEQLIKLDVR